MAILPNSRPSTGWRRGYLTNKCIKEIFDVEDLCYSGIETISTMTKTPWSSTPRDTATTPRCKEAPKQCSRHKTIETIPRYPRDPKKISEI